MFAPKSSTLSGSLVWRRMTWATYAAMSASVRMVLAEVWTLKADMRLLSLTLDERMFETSTQVKRTRRAVGRAENTVSSKQTVK